MLARCIGVALGVALLSHAWTQESKAAWSIPLFDWAGKRTTTSDNRVFGIKASLNDGQILRFALDSSVAAVVLTESAARLAGLDLGAEISLPWTGGEKVRGRLFENAKIAAGEFAGVIRYGVAIPDEDFQRVFPLDAVLGLSFFREYTWTVDPKRAVLLLAAGGSPAPEGKGVSLPFTYEPDRGIELVVKVNGKDQPLIANTGLSDVFFDSALAKTVGIAATGPVVKSGPTPYQAGPKLSLGVGDLKVADLQVFITQERGWRHLGQSFFNRFVTTWDWKRQQVRFTDP